MGIDIIGLRDLFLHYRHDQEGRLLLHSGTPGSALDAGTMQAAREPPAGGNGILAGLALAGAVSCHRPAPHVVAGAPGS